MSRGIGWYVHHQGAGHLQRARAVSAKLSRPCTIMGTLSGGGTERVRIGERSLLGAESGIGIALGYKDGNIWATEGWWNIAPRSCETLLRGDLVARFYYVYAIDYDQGGEWAGKAYMCTRDKEFTIRGIEDCLARGFDRTGFFEVDTQEQKSWTVQLTEPQQTRSPQAGVPLPPAKTP